MTEHASSIDPAEVDRFSAIADQWWDPNGKFAPLHRFNPVRLDFIREHAMARFSRDGAARSPFKGPELIDIGCGGGLLSEPMTRLGFAVTGVDASDATSRSRAPTPKAIGLTIDYRCATAEAMLAETPALRRRPEHGGGRTRRRPRPISARLRAPDRARRDDDRRHPEPNAEGPRPGEDRRGVLLRWLPPETHDWRKFVTPDEVRAHLACEAVGVEGPFGVVFSPLSGRWRRSADADMNYMMVVSSGRPSRSCIPAVDRRLQDGDHRRQLFR